MSAETLDLAAAARRRLEARRVIALTAAKHGVDVRAVAGAHPARMRHHVVWARCNAAAELRDMGFGWKEVAHLLGMKGHSLAIRSTNKWRERQKGQTS